MMDRAEYAVTMGVAMTVLLGSIGYLLKRLIWKSKDEVANRLDQAKKFTSNFVFAASLASGQFFLKNGISEAIAQMVVVVVSFGAIGFVLGLLYWTVLREKNWKPLIWVVCAFVVFSLAENDHYGDDDMNFSMKYALLYAMAGFVASAYHLKEGGSAKAVAIGGGAICVAYTVATYGFNYGVLTAIEYAVGYGLAQLILKNESSRPTPHIANESNKANVLVAPVPPESLTPAPESGSASSNSSNESKTPSMSNGFWFFMAVVVMSGTALFIKLAPERSPANVEPSNLERPAVTLPATNASTDVRLPIEATESSHNKNEPRRGENIYMELDKEFMTTPRGGQGVMVIKVALMTQYDSRVFDNVYKHHYALRSAILELLRSTTVDEIHQPNFRQNLAVDIKVLMNDVLIKYEDFGGIEDVFFTSFVYQ